MATTIFSHWVDHDSHSVYIYLNKYQVQQYLHTHLLTHTHMGAETGKGVVEREWRGKRVVEERELSLVSATLGRSREEHQTPPFRTRHHLYYILYSIHCRQNLAPAVGKHLRTQDSAPARRCGTEGGNGHGNRDGGGDEYENEG